MRNKSEGIIFDAPERYILLDRALFRGIPSQGKRCPFLFFVNNL